LAVAVQLVAVLEAELVPEVVLAEVEVVGQVLVEELLELALVRLRPLPLRLELLQHLLVLVEELLLRLVLVVALEEADFVRLIALLLLLLR
jgi:hypothetical protein